MEAIAVGWRPSLLGGRPSLLGWRLTRAIAITLEAIAIRWEAIAIRLEAIASNFPGRPRRWQGASLLPVGPPLLGRRSLQSISWLRWLLLS